MVIFFCHFTCDVHSLWPTLFRMAYLLISVKRFEDTTDFSKRLKIGKRGEKKWFFNHDKSVGQPIEKKSQSQCQSLRSSFSCQWAFEWESEPIAAILHEEDRKNLKSNLLLLIIPNDQCQRDHFFFVLLSLTKIAFRQTLSYYSRWTLPFSTWWQITRKCFFFVVDLGRPSFDV